MNLRDGEVITNPNYFVPTQKKNSLLSKLAPVLYLQTNCDTSTERDAYVEQLMKFIQVDSYGNCLNNKELPLHRMYKTTAGDSVTYLYHLYGDELMKLMARYKFVITIENAVCNDYVTEKIWRAIEVGTVPIYYGSPLIRDWLPNNKSAILLEDFPTPELLSQHLQYLLNNDTAYEEYLEHKTLGIVTNKELIRELITRPYENDLDNTVKAFECFICEKIHDRTNKTVDIVNRSHYDCPNPTSALTFSLNPESKWVKYLPEARAKLDQIYKEVNDPDQTVRQSYTPWYG
ncbi:alpha-(1,3)-fucosyltransferase 10-like [Pectinophora gossypiella]|uniref:alpha-(1,3)-fucosyltransferase 10-like n=1 Tax=Pectinophora gossypiella TaxID=13191 RepID=UPI00214DF3D4|nr:alpha-(1,3)-fucosyltransferase 10-like [Pectinophora gossypiella]